MRSNLQEAFVIHSKPYKETSLLVTFFSSEDGKLSAIAKGAKRGMASTADDWRALPVHLMNGAIKGLVWGPGDHQLAAAT